VLASIEVHVGMFQQKILQLSPVVVFEVRPSRFT